MFSADVLTFREFAMNEPLPLAQIQNAVLEFLRDRDDVVVFGAQAVNAYVNEPRMTQDIDLMSPRAAELASASRPTKIGDRLARPGHAAVDFPRTQMRSGIRERQIAGRWCAPGGDDGLAGDSQHGDSTRR
jgi:hypothetical protein